MKRINPHLPSPFRYGEKSRRRRLLVILIIGFALYGLMMLGMFIR